MTLEGPVPHHLFHFSRKCRVAMYWVGLVGPRPLLSCQVPGDIRFREGKPIARPFLNQFLPSFKVVNQSRLLVNKSI